MRSIITRRININLTSKEEKYLEYLKNRYKEYGYKTTEADIVRDAIEALADNWEYEEN